MLAVRVLASFLLLTCTAATPAQDEKSHRGRKYKAPADTSHIEVQVLRGYNGKPIVNAAVVFHPIKDGHDEGNLELKTNEDGKAIIDIIPTGSTVGVQVIADGFATYAADYLVAEPTRAIEIKMLRPRAQISTYEDNQGQVARRKPGVQEPNHAHSDPVIQPAQPTNHTSDPAALAPVSPGATPGNSQNQQTGHPSGVPPQL